MRTASGSRVPQPPPAGNPFTPGVIVPPERFHGRRAELGMIRANLENGLSVSLVGAARIGKSRLLRYLEARLPEWLHAPGPCLPIYLSLDGQPSQAAFCQAVLTRLLPQMPLEAGHEPELRALEHRLAAHQPVTMEDLTLTLEWAVAGRLRVVLLLDEFKDLLERPAEFDEVFRRRLRSLYSDRTVALVLATRQPLSEIEGFSAYFANGISQYTIGVLMPGEAAQLLRQPHDRGFSADRNRALARASYGVSNPSSERSSA